MIQRKWKLITSGFISLFKTTKKSVNLPKSSDILRTYLKQRNLTSWTAFYVPRCEVQNDLWGQSHFNFEVDQANYHVLRTGAYPFVKVFRNYFALLLKTPCNYQRYLKVINIT